MKVDGWPCPYDLTCQLKTDTLVSGDVTKKQKKECYRTHAMSVNHSAKHDLDQYKETFIHAVVTIRVVAKLLYGLTADQTGIDGLSS